MSLSPCWNVVGGGLCTTPFGRLYKSRSSVTIITSGISFCPCPNVSFFPNTSFSGTINGSFVVPRISGLFSLVITNAITLTHYSGLCTGSTTTSQRDLNIFIQGPGGAPSGLVQVIMSVGPSSLFGGISTNDVNAPMANALTTCGAGSSFPMGMGGFATLM